MLEKVVEKRGLFHWSRTVPTRIAIGSFIFGASGLPLQIPFAQIPAVWAESSDLSGSEAMGAAVVGLVIRTISAFALAWILTPMV